MSSETSMQKVIDQFDSFNFYLDSKLDRDIEENRKGQFLIHFTDESGRKLPNVDVTVRQISHEFNFGCTVFYLDQFPDEERNRAYRDKFTKIFNYAVIPLYWDTLEPEEGKPRFAEDSVKISRRPPVNSAVRFCTENNLRMKGHCLIYNSFQPDWLPESNREIKIKIDNRLKALSERYPTTFQDADVINEMISIYKNCYKGNGCRNLMITDERDHEKWSFDICKKYFPHTRLFWNEGMYETFGEQHYRGYRSFYYMALREWLDKGAPIEGIGMQFHANGDRDRIFEQIKTVCNPLRLLDVFDCYGEFGLPIHVSEVSVPSFTNEAEDEQLQAALVRRLYKLWFGRKNCNSIVWWNLADNTAFRGENRFHSGLLRSDCTAKPAYDVLDELIHKEWHTEFRTTANGRLNFSGFYGDYEIEAVCEGRRTVKKIRLFQENTGYNNKLCDFRGVTITI